MQPTTLSFSVFPPDYSYHFIIFLQARLCSKLGSTQTKAAQQSASTQDLSARLVRSEEEKLKVEWKNIIILHQFTNGMDLAPGLFIHP